MQKTSIKCVRKKVQLEKYLLVVNDSTVLYTTYANDGNSLEVQWLGLHASNTGVAG